MARINRRTLLGAGLLTVPGLLAPFAGAEEKKVVAAPGQAVNITINSGAAAPDVSLALGKRDAKVTPCRSGCNHTGGGNIAVTQPSPDTIEVLMTGVAVAHGSPAGPATASLDFILTQCFDVSFDNPKVKTAKLSIEAEVIGFLRSHKHGTASESGSAAVTGGAGPVLAVDVPSHSVGAGQSLGINDKCGPVTLVVPAGSYTLAQTFNVSACMPKVILPCKSPSAEFAPGALDPLWIPAKEPFKGANKDATGFKVIIKVAADQVAD